LTCSPINNWPISYDIGDGFEPRSRAGEFAIHYSCVRERARINQAQNYESWKNLQLLINPGGFSKSRVEKFHIISAHGPGLVPVRADGEPKGRVVRFSLEAKGAKSKWITLTALRILKRVEKSTT
jgi:hypothetical protein